MCSNRAMMRCGIMFLLCVTSFHYNFASHDVPSFEESKLVTNVSSGFFDTPYVIEVNRTIEYIFEFRNNAVSLTKPVRLSVESSYANRSFPVIVVVRQQKGVLSWQLPVIVETKSGLFGHNKTARTLCPDNNYYLPRPGLASAPAYIEDVVVSISTASPSNLRVSLNVSLEHDFFVELLEERNITVMSPTEPRYYGFKFPTEGPSTVLLRVDSQIDTCMTVSIQNMSCPVFDLERNVEFEGYWQTINTRGGITLTRESFPNGLYIVFVVKGDDLECGGISVGDSLRSKSVTFSISPGISMDDYLIATFGIIAVFLVFYVFTILIAVLHFIRYRRNLQRSEEPSTDPTLSPSSSRHCVGGSPAAGRRNSANSSIRDRTSSDSSLDETDIDVLRDADEDKNIFRTKVDISVYDLARKHPRILQKKSQLYFWNLLTIGMFYGLPVVQLVITYQNVLNQTGNQDLCYYNFLCAHPFGFLSDFNHVYSNIGYVLLGLLFMALTYRRELIHKTAAAHLDRSHGIPQHFGLFYSMGAALIMEGIMSACYHICPNHSNFQFDTSFMYVIALICMVKIYQTRHPDINASAYATYGVLAAVIFIGMFGVLEGSLSFWITFTCLHLTVCLFLTVQIYYMGRWKLDCGVFQRVFHVYYNDLRASPLSCLKPSYPNRMVLLLLGNGCNWALAVLGLKYHQRDFATYLLIIFMSNLMLYYLFYIVMKLLNSERIMIQPFIYILLAFTTWGAALYFFFNKSISWALTPAGSRSYNQPCKILDFYDNHDIWHFLSAASMFFSFNSLLSLDDDLAFVHRTKIPVF